MRDTAVLQDIRCPMRQSKRAMKCFWKNKMAFPQLSMGMSHDYEIAINCGSNCVRLGEAIFGKRDYSKIN